MDIEYKKKYLKYKKKYLKLKGGSNEEGFLERVRSPFKKNSNKDTGSEPAVVHPSFSERITRAFKRQPDQVDDISQGQISYEDQQTIQLYESLKKIDIGANIIKDENGMELLLTSTIDTGNKAAEVTQNALVASTGAAIVASYAGAASAVAAASVTSGVATGGIAIIPILAFSLYIYINLKVKKLRLIIANSTLNACCDIIKDLCKINMFYKYTQIKHKEHGTGNSLNPYRKILKSENTNIGGLENMVYQTLYKLLNEVDIDLLDYNYREKFDAVIRASFDFVNPKYIWDSSTHNYKVNSNYAENSIKFRYTTEKCNLTKNRNSDIIKFKSNMTELEKVCNNYNDIIVRTMEKKINKMDKMDEQWKTKSKSEKGKKNDSFTHYVNRKVRSYIPDPFAGTNLNIMIRSYTVLGVTYSLVIGRYLIHSNEALGIQGFEPSEVYDLGALDTISNFLKTSKDISKDISNRSGNSAEEVITKLNIIDIDANNSVGDNANGSTASDEVALDINDESVSLLRNAP